MQEENKVCASLTASPTGSVVLAYSGTGRKPTWLLLRVGKVVQGLVGMLNIPFSLLRAKESRFIQEKDGQIAIPE